jgi:hypothetical protein
VHKRVGHGEQEAVGGGLADQLQSVSGVQNRNKIRTKSGIQWLTVPVLKQHGQRIEQARIAAKWTLADRPGW